MVVLASLFIMAMMQFFAATVSRGRHVLHRLTLTDYMAESALQEAVTFFNASVNRFGKPGGTPDPNLMKLQAALIESFKGGGDNVADAEFEPVLTRKLYDEILNYGDMNDFIPKVTIRLVRQEEANPFSSDTKYGTGGLAYFSVTVVHKDPGLRNTFKGSHKTVTRAYQFRHYMMAPPTDWVLDSTALREHRVIARNFAYARTRVKQHYDDFSSLV